MFYYLAVAGNIIAVVLGIIVIVRWIKAKTSAKQIFENLGFVPFKLSELITGLFIGLVAISILFAILFFLESTKIVSIEFHFSSFIRIFIQLLIFVLLEEIIFRSLFINGLKQFTDNKLYILLYSALLFAIVHLANPGVSPLSVVSASLGGAMYAYAFLIMNRLWLPIGIHFSWNFIQGYLYGLPVSGLGMDSLFRTDLIGSDIITGGTYGPEGSITGIFARFLVFLLLYSVDRNKQ